MNNIYDACKAAHVEIDNHESDLYIPVNELTQSLVEQYPHKEIVTKFVSQIDGKLWYDVPFAYEPYWEAKRYD